MKDPVFSIIVPCYNQAHFLPECLESLIGQTYDGWEAIVINDGSPDNTSGMASTFQRKDSRIKLLEKQNGGLSSARNAGLKVASGDWYIFLDADDMLERNCLDCVLEVIRKQPEYMFIRYGYTHISEDGKSMHEVLIKHRNSLIPSLLTGNIGPPISIAISRTLAREIGHFDEQLRSAEDWDYWIRAAKTGAKHVAIAQALAMYRYTQNSMSRNAFRMYDALKEVALRAVQKDDRLTSDFPDNRDYPEINPNHGIQRSLAMCLGVAVMQGNIEGAVALFNKETEVLNLAWQPANFEPMCSYLTFRYLTTFEKTKWVLKGIQPKFEDFLKRLHLEHDVSNRSLHMIFRKHRMHYNLHQFGIAGRVYNKMVH